MMTMCSVQSGHSDTGFGDLTVKDTVATWTDRSQRFRRQGLHSRMWTLSFQKNCTLPILSWTPLVTAWT